MDVSLTCIERNRAYTEQMPHVARTEACVQGNPGLRAPSQPLRIRNASLCRSVEELRAYLRIHAGCPLSCCFFADVSVVLSSFTSCLRMVPRMRWSAAA